MVHFKNFSVWLLLGALFIPSLAGAQSTQSCSQFARNLRFGMAGEDVRTLQKILNTLPSTKVAAIGPGAPGEETTYFGNLTLSAVIKFQELYAGEVLAPVGLSRGSGFVGTYSRAKIMALCSKDLAVRDVEKLTPTTTSESETPSAVKLPTATTLTPIAQASANAPLTVMNPSQYTVNPGKKVSIMGAGFVSTGNNVHIGAGITISDVRPNMYGYLEITIPTTAPKGKFDLWVTNSKGTSNLSWIIVADPKFAKPVITNFTPTSGLQGTTVTLTGEGFTPTDNEIYIGSTPIKGITSADGKTLSFTVFVPDIGLGVGEESAAIDLEFPMWFSVVNANGESNSKVFNLKI